MNKEIKYCLTVLLITFLSIVLLVSQISGLLLIMSYNTQKKLKKEKEVSK